jgi:hypothetical protein
MVVIVDMLAPSGSDGETLGGAMRSFATPALLSALTLAHCPVAGGSCLFDNTLWGLVIDHP